MGGRGNQKHQVRANHKKNKELGAKRKPTKPRLQLEEDPLSIAYGDAVLKEKLMFYRVEKVQDRSTAAAGGGFVTAGPGEIFSFHCGAGAGAGQ